MQNHYASMLGIYDVFIYTQGARIMIKNSIEVPKRPGVWVHHACNVNISGTMGGFDRIINDTIASTYYTTNQGQRRHIVDYRYTHYEEDEPLPADEDGSEGSETPEWDQWMGVEAPAASDIDLDMAVTVYPNPTVSDIRVQVADPASANVVVTNLAGQELIRTNAERPIPFTDLVRGTYMVQVTTAAGSKTFKVVKL